METQDNNSVIQDDTSIYGTKVQPIIPPEQNIGVDLDQKFLKDIADAGISSTLDLSEIERFTQVGQNRDQMYTQIDSLCQDSTMAAVLETYSEDATEYNAEGKIVWATADNGDANESKYLNYLLTTLQIDKHIYKWIHCLCKYGDVYIQLFKKSEYDDDPLFDLDKDKDKKKTLNEKLTEVLDSENNKDANKLEEDVKIQAYASDDKYAPYVEMVANPAEMFELTKHGKTMGYIKADVMNTNRQLNQITNLTPMYSFSKRDITIYSAEKFVHASLEENTDRRVEKVSLYLEDITEDADAYEYNVKSGQSIFYSIFKIWRQLSLLENAVLLNRVTKSSMVRAIQVQVGDMADEEIAPLLLRIKALFEQKEAINVGTSMNEYNNPGPVENNIYIPVKGDGKGSIQVDSVGGDFNVTQLPDLEYFQNKLWGGLRAPKQFFGLTDDAAGFSGGESLAEISSRYAKFIKRLQSTILEMIKTMVNLFLIDRGMTAYVNNFTLHMQTPSTKAEVERQENASSKIQITRDIMDLLTDIDNPATKLEITKILLSGILTDGEITSILEDEIKKLQTEDIEPEPGSEEDIDLDTEIDFGESGGDSSLGLDSALGLEGEEGEEGFEEPSEEIETDLESEESLPSPSELDLDFTDNTNPEFER